MKQKIQIIADDLYFESKLIKDQMKKLKKIIKTKSTKKQA